MRKLLNAVTLPYLLVSIIRNLKLQQRFLEKNISPILKQAVESNDGTLGEKDIQKILRYYGLAVPAILAEAFASLRGEPLNENERMVSTCQGAMTGLFDDFFDEAKLEEDEIKSKLEGLRSNAIIPSNEKLFDIFYEKSLSLSHDPLAIKNALKLVYENQVESKLQATSELDKHETLRITLAKGGNSLLFYRTALSHAMQQKEKEIIYRLGGLMQLANDLFDVYKDREAGIKTPLMFISEIKELETYFSKELKDVYRDAYALPYPIASIRRFLGVLSMGVFSRCFVCFHQLKKLQETSGNVFKPELYTRTQLICDMDTKKNMLRSAAYHIKYFR